MTGRAAERGMILLVVLWTLALMSVVAVALSAYVQRSILVAEVDQAQTRTELALRSAFSAAAATLWAMKPEQRAVLYGEQREVNLGGGRSATVEVSEATGRADLNAANVDLLKALFGTATGSKSRGDALAEAVFAARGAADKAGAQENADANQQQNGNNGQDPNQPGQGEQAKPPPRAPAFQTPLQLQLLKEADARSINAILPLVGVVSRGGRVNALSAPDAVLRAVPKITAADIAVILRARARKDTTGQELKTVVDRYNAFLTLEPSRAFIVAVKLKPAPGIIGGSSAFATILLTPDGAKPFQFMAMSW